MIGANLRHGGVGGPKKKKKKKKKKKMRLGWKMHVDGTDIAAVVVSLRLLGNGRAHSGASRPARSTGRETGARRSNSQGVPGGRAPTKFKLVLKTISTQGRQLRGGTIHRRETHKQEPRRRKKYKCKNRHSECRSHVAQVCSRPGQTISTRRWALASAGLERGGDRATVGPSGRIGSFARVGTA